MNFYYGFLDNKKPLETGKIEKVMDKCFLYDGKALTRKQFIEQCILNNSYVKYEQNVRKWTKNDIKIVPNYYSIHHPGKDYYNEITKTEYDYASYLIDNGYNNKEKMMEYEVIETKRVQEEEERIKQEKEKAEQERKNKEQEKIQFDTWLWEQAQNYPENEKYNILKEIFLSEIGDFYQRSAILLVLIDNIENQNCRDKLKEWLHNGNQASKKVFFHVTGIKLPTTYKETINVLDNVTKNDFTGIVPYVKRKDKEEPEQTTFYRLTRDQGYVEARGEYIKKYDFDLYISKSESGLYSITEGQTGLLISQTCKTKAEAMASVKTTIEKMGIEKVKEFINNSIERNGISPLYQTVTQ